MDSNYLLNQLKEAGKAMRKAQKDYYACKLPRTDRLKQSHLDEAQRRERDFDRLLITAEKALPTLTRP